MSDALETLSVSDLYIFKNALNEICNGIDLDEWDFETRMGVTREEARALLERVGLIYRKRTNTNDHG